jgi:hypothetical protein
MARHNFKKGPFEAYEGEEPYIFISYKHADSEIVFPIIKQFHDAGFNIWYDDGLKYGADYDDLIDYKIDNSSLFVICITKKVIEGAYDPKEYMKKELDVAIDTDTKMFPIFLEDVKLKGKYRMQLKGMHSIFKHEHTDEEFLKKCITAFKEDFGIEPNETINKDIHDLNEDENTPFKAYSYIYASYPHNDEENALSDIKRFQEDGYNVFYNPGSDYNNQIANAIANSSLFVVFISNNSVESIYIQNEIMLALSEKIPIITI